MKRLNWQVMLGLSLLMFSTLFYLLHYLIFRDAHHIFIYLLGDIAFVFIEVLLVTIIIDRILQQRDKKERLNKLNMVIGAFFSEVGTELLELLTEADTDIERLSMELERQRGTTDKEYQKVAQWLQEHKFNIGIENADLEQLYMFLRGKRDFLLRLLENPNLLEHESFSDLLWAVFHIVEELGTREDLRDLPVEDLQHLRGDINRVYGQLARQWLDYMKHLKKSYPYLFSLALRMNPFNQNASPVVRS